MATFIIQQISLRRITSPLKNYAEKNPRGGGYIDKIYANSQLTTIVHFILKIIFFMF